MHMPLSVCLSAPLATLLASVPGLVPAVHLVVCPANVGRISRAMLALPVLLPTVKKLLHGGRF
jgi:hypothetical protein